MNQKTLVFVSCFILAFICALCIGAFAFLFHLLNTVIVPIPPKPEPVACTMEAKMCDDGSYVGRNPDKACEFDACPTIKACTDDAKICPDGSAVGRDAKNNCEFKECPSTNVSACTQDIKMCPDGSYVSRDPENQCQFKSCN